LACLKEWEIRFLFASTSLAVLFGLPAPTLTIWPYPYGIGNQAILAQERKLLSLVPGSRPDDLLGKEYHLYLSGEVSQTENILEPG
jgi:hypothetical protein